ncbi:MAG: MBL fold metallo-hydrolase [Deferribacteraceae bacterium]|jgi:glyoxylase-like metal-dependent hydrolase (beta-lactamase superfamily II)|nr:MBL fold metallo-hydrolase [Deferribacteraceae bacterium]
MRVLISALLIIVAMSGVALSETGGFAAFTVGGVKVISLSDTYGNGDTSKLIGYTAEQKAKYTPDDKIIFSVNAYLVVTKNKTVLIDAGMGKNAGKMFDALTKAGVNPKNINIVAITHMHGDHIGGLLTDGKPSFPNAELWISAPEKKYWYDETKNESAVKAIDAYGKKVKLFKQGDKITPEIASLETIGHTPGHTSYLLTSGSDSLLIWGDLMHVYEVQFPLPQIAITYDTDAKTAVSSRLRILDEAVKNKWRIAGVHLPFPGIGYATKDGDGYKWNPDK